MTMQSTGRCMCGETTFTGTRKENTAHTCHCDDCQRFTGGAFIGVDFEKLEVKGPVRWFKSSDWGQRGSCANCGSALFWRLNSGGHDVAALGAIDDKTVITGINQHYFADNICGAYDYKDDGVRLSRAETIALFSGEGE